MSYLPAIPLWINYGDENECHTLFLFFSEISLVNVTQLARLVFIKYLKEFAKNDKIKILKLILILIF